MRTTVLLLLAGCHGDLTLVFTQNNYALQQDTGLGDVQDPEPDSTTTTPSSTSSTSNPSDTASLDTALPMPPLAVVHESGPILCADPSLRREVKFDVVELAAQETDEVRVSGAGAGVADFNGDDRPDVMFMSPVELDYLWNRPGMEFEVAPGGAVRGTASDHGFGLAIADADGDGDLDAYMTRYNRRNSLLLNDGDGWFVDASVERGLPREDHYSGSATWGDIDGDGDLDLFVAGHGELHEDIPFEEHEPGAPSFLYLNDGHGFFEDASHLLPEPAQEAYTFLGGLVDLNGDRLPELYLINDLGQAQKPCQLLWNRWPEPFEHDNDDVGLDVEVSGMGLGIGDLNADGQHDFLVPAWGRHRLLYSRTDVGAWFDYSDARDMIADDDRNQKVGWGSDLADMDNDGDHDATMIYGWIDTEQAENERDQPDAIYLHEEGGSFRDVAEEWGVADTTNGRGQVVADLNHDGWLDLVKPSIDGPRRIYLSRCGHNAWLEVSLRSPAPNTFAVGARVEVHVGESIHTRTLFAGGTSYGASGPMELHFGLGSADAIDRVDVHWPDGVVTTHGPFTSRQRLRIERL